MVGEVAFQLLLMLDSTIRLAAPLVLAAMAGLFCRAGRRGRHRPRGQDAGAAFAAAAVAQTTDSAWLGLLAGMAFGVGLAMVHGFASITHRGDQVVSGMALNVIAAGLGPTLADAWFRQAGRSRSPPRTPASPRSTCRWPTRSGRSPSWGRSTPT